MTPATLRRHSWAVRARSLAIAGALAFAAALIFAGPAAAVVGPVDPTAPVAPIDPTVATAPGISVGINGIDGTPSSSIIVLVAITLLSVAPSLLLMTTSFTKVFVVLVLTRNALGLQGGGGRRQCRPTQSFRSIGFFEG